MNILEIQRKQLETQRAIQHSKQEFFNYLKSIFPNSNINFISNRNVITIFIDDNKLNLNGNSIEADDFNLVSKLDLNSINEFKMNYNRLQDIHLNLFNEEIKIREKEAEDYFLDNYQVINIDDLLSLSKEKEITFYHLSGCIIDKHTIHHKNNRYYLDDNPLYKSVIKNVIDGRVGINS